MKRFLTILITAVAFVFFSGTSYFCLTAGSAAGPGHLDGYGIRALIYSLLLFTIYFAGGFYIRHLEKKLEEKEK